jgi:hypothetical protein
MGPGKLLIAQSKDVYKQMDIATMDITRDIATVLSL